MTLREQLCDFGINWSTWTVRTSESEISESERWLDYWVVIRTWPNVSEGFHHQLLPSRRLVMVTEPGILGRRWAVLVMVPGLDSYIS